ncbi:MAG: hypothetical protein ABJG68_13975 [Crocinitomicaceae bacterium]
MKLDFFKQIINGYAAKAYDKILKEKLQKIKANPIFWSDFSNGYIEYSELAGYRFLNIRIIGPTKLDSVNGLSFEFISGNKSETLNSDSDIVKSDYSDVSQIGLTKFDLDCEDKTIHFLYNHKVDTIRLSAKNGQLLKEEVVMIFTNFDQQTLLKKLPK